AAVNALRRASIADLIGDGFVPIEHVIRAQEKQPGTMLLRSSRHMRRAITVHGERQLAIRFASIYIGVRRGEHNPIWMCFFNRIRNLPRITNVRIFRAESGYLIFPPLAHERLAQQTGCAEDGDSHSELS